MDHRRFPPSAVLAVALLALVAGFISPAFAQEGVPAGQMKPGDPKLNLNTTPTEAFMVVPNVGRRMAHEFDEYRPYVSILQFRKEIGKYVDAQQVASFEQFVYVPIKVDACDAATLQQIPEVDEAKAKNLIAGRPYGSNEAFLKALAGQVSAEAAAIAKSYLDR
jgi:radical SAM superfamily enzyme with C-terminal helix-hairpin-helix motif